MSRIFPTQFGAPLTQAGDVDADDPFLVTQDGFIKPANPSSFKGLMLPDGTTDVAAHTALAEQVLISFDTLAALTSLNGTTATNTGTGTETRTEGTGCLRWTAVTNNGTTPTKVYYTFAVAQTVGTRSAFALELAYQVGAGGSPARPDLFVVKVADGTALTGNVVTAIVPSNTPEYWQTIVLPLDGLTSIKSVGLERISPVTDSWTSGGTMVWWLDNGRFPAESQLDRALASADSIGVFVGGTYDHAASQLKPAVELGKSVLDFQQSSFSGFNRTIWLDSFYIDATGATDVTEKFSSVVNSAPVGSTIKAPTGALYRFDSRVIVSRLQHVTLDLSEATCFITWEIDQDFITIDNCAHVTVIVGQMFGYHDVTQTANAMSSLAGTPTLVGTVYELNAQDEAIKSSADTVRTWPMARTLNQQVGRPGSGAPKWNWKISAKDTAQVADDLVVYAYDSITLEVLATATYTATASYADYWLQIDPVDLQVLPVLAVKKGTATANTISVASHSRYGRVDYNAAYDSASCFALQDCEHINIVGPDGTLGVIEGFGADAIQLSNPNVHHTLIRNILSNGCRRQGMSFNQGTYVTVEDCVIMNSGRSGIDLEPYTSVSLVDHILLRNIEVWNARNYTIAFTNWANLTNLDMENIRSYNPGIGFCVGGSRGGTYRNLKSLRTDNNASFNTVMEFYGIDLTIDGVYTDGYIACYTDVSTYNSVSYRCANNKITGLNFVGNTGITGAYRLRVTGETWAVGEIRYAGDVEANITVTNPVSYGAIGLNIPDTANWSTWQPGEIARQLPNTFKGNAYKSVWVPGGFNVLDDPVYGVHSLSGNTTRGNNLRGISATVAASASTLTVAFPVQVTGTFTTLPQTFSWTGTGSLTGSTTYYYRIAPRGRVKGPGTYCTQLTRLTAAGQTRVLINLVVAIDHIRQVMHEGWTVLRGITNGGPYTQRADMIPNSQLWGHRGEAVELFDDGVNLTFNLTTPSSALFGYPQSVPFVNGSWTGTVDESGWEPDTNYDVWVTTNWDSGQPYITPANKTAGGFTVTFPYEAPADGSGRVSWLVVR